MLRQLSFTIKHMFFFLEPILSNIKSNAFFLKETGVRKKIYFENPQGQSLIEYLIIVALIAVSTIGMVKAVGTNVSVHFANITKALAGDASKDISPLKIQSDQVQTRDLHDYMKGATAGPRK